MAHFLSDGQLECWGEMVFDAGIGGAFLDNTMRQFIAVCTRDGLLHVVSIRNKCTSCYTFECTPFRLCFFYAGENSSPTNKLKDRVYLLWQERADASTIHTEEITTKSSVNSSILEFRKVCLPNGQPYTLKLIAEYSLATGAVKQLLFNRHDLSLVRVLNPAGSLLSYNISGLYDGAD